jgi:virginiamycin B lyase
MKPTVALVCLLALVFAGQSSAADEVAEVKLPRGAIGALAADAEGSVWFIAPPRSLDEHTRYGRVRADGGIEEFDLGFRTGYVSGVAIGPEGNLWMAAGDSVYRGTPTGEVTSFPLSAKDDAGQIVAGADGNLWITVWMPGPRDRRTESVSGPAFVVRLTPGGEMTRLELPGPAKLRTRAPAGIVLGPDGNVWFTDPALGRIGRVTPGGEITEHQLDVAPEGLTSGRDGNLWFAHRGGLGRISPGGEVKLFPLPVNANRITTGPEGNLYFTGSPLGLGRMTPSGHFAEFGTNIGDPGELTTSADGQIWFTTSAKFAIVNPLGKFTPPGPAGTEVRTTAATVRDGKLDVELACGGAPGGCAGTVRVGAPHDPELASTSYSLGSESEGTFSLTLSPADRRLLAQKRYLREYVAVDATQGTGTYAAVVLRRPHPFRGMPRPGRPLLVPLPSEVEAGAIAAGWDGNLWMGGGTGYLTRITPHGELSRYGIPGLEREAAGLVAGPRRSIWFLESASYGFATSLGYYLGRVSARGRFSETLLPPGPVPADLAVGPDGDLWVSRSSYHRAEVDRVMPGGKVTRFRVGEEMGAITAGPRHSVWFALAGTAIGRIGADGRLEKFSVPGRGYIDDITAGPDGNLWYTHWGRRGPSTIGRMTPSGRVAEFPTHPRGTPGGSANSIIAGPDGNLWFTEWLPARIGRITPQGKIKRWRRGAAAAGNIAVGPEGNLWLSSVEQETLGVVAPGRRRP